MKMVMKMDNIDDYHTIEELCILLNTTPSRIIKRIQKKIIKNVIIYKKKRYINKNEIDNLRKSLDISIPEGYISIKEAVEILKVPEGTLAAWIYTDVIQGTLKIPAATVPIIVIPKKSIEEIKSIWENNYTVKDLGIELQLSEGAIMKRIREGKYPNHFHYVNKIYIPKEDVKNYEKELRDNEFIKLDKNDVIHDFYSNMKRVKVPPHLNNTKELFLLHTNNYFNKSKGSVSTIYNMCRTYQHVFEKIIINLPKEVYELMENEVENAINETTSAYLKQIFTIFYNFSLENKGLRTKPKYVYSRNQKQDTISSDIYSPKEFNAYYLYVSEINVHIKESMESKLYANMWLYTLMLMIDAWRAKDIVLGMPNVDITEIDVTSLDWFTNNKLDLYTSQVIVNQMYYYFKSLSTTKTGELLEFVINNDLVIPLANALVICELHRQKKNDRYLLRTLVIGHTDRVIPPTESHKVFFKHKPELMNFSSRKMNRSMMTYLYHSIAESGNNSVLAMQIIQQVRSHLSPKSTEIYVESTNQDGTLERITINAFKRGHFGWLYTLILSLLLNKTVPEPEHSITTTQQTTYVESIRAELTPLELENHSDYLRKINKKKKFIFDNLLKLNKDELVDLVRKIYTDQLPSKTPHTQCLIYPKCEYPKKNNCYSCEYMIPKNYLLLYVKAEFEKLIQNISEQSNPNILKRDSYFVLNLIVLLEEAIAIFDKSYVSTFVDLKRINHLLYENSHKILLD